MIWKQAPESYHILNWENVLEDKDHNKPKEEHLCKIQTEQTCPKAGMTKFHEQTCPDSGTNGMKIF